MLPTTPHLSPRGRISSSIDGAFAGLGTAELIGIVGAIILAVVIVVLVVVLHHKKAKQDAADAADAEKNATIDAWSGSDMPAGEMRRDAAYEEELRRGGRTPGTGPAETVGLLPAVARMEGAVVRR